MPIHTGERLQVCWMCHQRLTDLYYLKTHMLMNANYMLWR